MLRRELYYDKMIDNYNVDIYITIKRLTNAMQTVDVRVIVISKYICSGNQ